MKYQVSESIHKLIRSSIGQIENELIICWQSDFILNNISVSSNLASIKQGDSVVP